MNVNKHVYIIAHSGGLIKPMYKPSYHARLDTFRVWIFEVQTMLRLTRISQEHGRAFDQVKSQLQPNSTWIKETRRQACEKKETEWEQGVHYGSKVKRDSDFL